MDFGGMNVALIAGGAAVLFLVLLFAVMRTKSTGKESSNPTTERATRELYEEEDRTTRTDDI
ncbi:MAG TPA: hypothetical protein VHM21_01400 [Sphingomicrobium sp.]|jgi:hypothetical protein|nr:hypothetical protein [Sphingomicrobium sp.]